MTKSKKQLEELEKQIDELVADLKRQRADFENYRKRVEAEKQQVRASTKASTVLQILPVIDTLERAISHRPDDLKGNKWADGVTSMTKQLEKQLGSLEVERIKASEGTVFNPDLHEAIQVDEDATGSSEVISKELQPGYTLAGQVIRPALVKVTRK